HPVWVRERVGSPAVSNPVWIGRAPYARAVRRRKPLPVAALSALVSCSLLAAAVGGPADAGGEAPGVAAARAAAQQATQDYADAQAALGVIGQELAQLEAERQDAE